MPGIDHPERLVHHHVQQVKKVVPGYPEHGVDAVGLKGFDYQVAAGDFCHLLFLLVGFSGGFYEVVQEPARLSSPGKWSGEQMGSWLPFGAAARVSQRATNFVATVRCPDDGLLGRPVKRKGLGPG